MAVCYREERDEVNQWAIIEDGPDPDMARNEFSPDHAISKALSGHKVGETVTVSDTGPQPRVVSIRQAFHKYIFRYEDCRDRYQLRFPGGTAIQMIHVGSGDEFDPSPIIRSLEDRKQHIETLDKNYADGPMPFAMYAELAGSDELTAWAHLAWNPKLGIRSGEGDGRELRAAIDRVKECKTLVLDLTAVITLSHLNLLHAVQGGTRRCVVTQSVFERVQHLLDRAEDDWGAAGTVVLAPDGALARIDASPDQKSTRVAFLAKVRDSIQSGCEIRPCPQAAALDPDRRESLVQILGRPSLDSILLSASTDTVLWTDDSVLGLLGRTDFSVERAWTQAVLFILWQEGVVTQQEFDRTVAQMVGWHYHGMILNEETLVAAAEVSEWQMDRWPVPAVMQTLQNPSADAVMRLRIAAQAVKAVWRRDLPNLARQGFLSAVLCGLRSVRLVMRLHQVIPLVFSVDVLSADEVRDYIAVWLRHPPTLLLP